MKKIWMAMMVWTAVECLAFPEILFPDCIEAYQTDVQENDRNEKAEDTDYRFESFWLKYFSRIR